jgi:hypothetical protein
VLGRASHGPPRAACRGDVDPEELLMMSVVEGMDKGIEDLRPSVDRIAKVGQIEAVPFDVEETK